MIIIIALFLFCIITLRYGFSCLSKISDIEKDYDMKRIENLKNFKIKG